MVIRISSLTKIYRRGAQPALDDVDLTIPHGTFGLLGPNGAGKTTLIKILSTQMEASSGLLLNSVFLEVVRFGSKADVFRRPSECPLSGVKQTRESLQLSMSGPVSSAFQAGGNSRSQPRSLQIREM